MRIAEFGFRKKQKGVLGIFCPERLSVFSVISVKNLLFFVAYDYEVLCR